MWKPGMSAAEERLATARWRQEQMLKEKEQARTERAEKTAHLRARRLAKEAANEENDG